MPKTQILEQFDNDYQLITDQAELDILRDAFPDLCAVLFEKTTITGSMKTTITGAMVKTHNGDYSSVWMTNYRRPFGTLSEYTQIL